MSQPISRRLLPHLITVDRYLRTDGGKSYYDPVPVTLTWVRVEPVKQTAQKSLGEMKNDRFKIFVDRVNTYPQAFELKAKDRVTFNGTQVFVRAVEPLYGTDAAVHHWEVYCGV